MKRTDVSWARVNGGSANGDEVKQRIMRATAEDNASILTELRDIVRGQLQKLRSAGLSAPFTPAQAGILHRLAQTYAILDTKTREEHRRYDFSGASDEELERIAGESRALLGKER